MTAFAGSGVPTTPAIRLNIFMTSPPILHEDWSIDSQLEQPIPYVYTFPLLSPEYCDWLIAEGNKSNKWGFNRKDPYAAFEVDLSDLNPAIDYQNRSVALEQIGPKLGQLFDWTDPKTVSKCLLIKYQPDHCNKIDMHYDPLSLVSLSISLNDEYQGGGLTFVSYPNKTITAPKGHAIMFPGNPMFAHEAKPTTAGERYVLVYWIRSN